MKRALKWVLIVLLVLLTLLVVLMTVASIVIDSKTGAILNKVSSKVPGLTLSQVSKGSGVLTKKGAIEVNYAPKNGVLGQRNVSFVVKYEAHIGVSGVSGTFTRVPGSGNLDDFGRPLLKELPPLGGTFALSPASLTLSGSVNAGAFELPVADGTCNVGESRADFSVNAAKDLTVAFSSEGAECRSPKVYSGRAAYTLNLKKLHGQLKPALEGHRLKGLSGTIAADELSADASTIYLIGFSPDDKVRDPSLRDGFLFTKPVLGFGFEESRGGFGTLEASLNGSFAFGFPKVRESRMIPMWSFDSLKFKGSVSELNPQALLKASSKAPSRDKEGTENDAGKAALEAAFAAVSSPLKLRLEDFSFSHEGSEVKLSGLAQAQLDRKALKPQSVRAEINAAASREFVRKLAEDGYEDEFAQALSSGMFTQQGDMLRTKAVLRDGELTLNGQSAISAQQETAPLPGEEPEAGDGGEDYAEQADK